MPPTGDPDNLTQEAWEELYPSWPVEICAIRKFAIFKDPRPNPPALRSRSRIWREIVRASDRPQSTQDFFIFCFIANDDPELLAA